MAPHDAMVWGTGVESQERKHRNKLGQTLVLLTSTRHRRFVEDIVAITALPAGARWRFRYLQRYVDPAINNYLDMPLARGMCAVIGIVGFEEDGVDMRGGPSAGRYIELARAAKVLSLKREGQLIVIDYELDGYVNSPVDMPNAIPPDIARNLPHRSGNASPQGWFFFTAPQLEITTGKDVQDWERIAEVTLTRTPTDMVPYTFGLFPSGLGRSRRLKNGNLTIQATQKASIDIQTLCRREEKSDVYAAAIGEVKLGITHPAMSFVSSSTVRIDTHRNAKAVTIQSLPAFGEAVGHVSVLAFAFEKNATVEGAKVNDGQTRAVHEARDSSDHSSRRPAFVRLDIALSSGSRATWAFCLLAALVVGLSAIKLEHTRFEVYEPLRVIAIAVITMFGLRRGLSLKG